MRPGWMAIVMGMSLLVTPVPADAADLIPASSCDVTPRSAADLDHLVEQATPASGYELEPYIIAESELPVGVPADERVVEEVADRLAIRAACVRDLDALRFFALYTDRYLIDLFSVTGPPDWENPPGESAATPLLRPDYQLGVVDEVLLLEDGRVSAFVTYVGDDIEDSQPRPGVTYLMIFERVNGVWLIDRQYEDYYDPATQWTYPVADLLNDVATPAS